MRTELLGALASVISSLAWAGGPPSPSFTRKPVVTRAGEKVEITFAVSRETDVAVYIENAKGDIVRHLVAGVLGKNPPQPLKADSLSQSIEWDGLDDDGKKAQGGPFKVRVGLGLKASWGGTAFADPDKTGPNRVECIIGMTAGPDGRLYVLDRIGAWLYWQGTKLHVFRRDGAYEKTIKPFPSHLPLERVKAAGAFINQWGYLNPTVQRPHHLNIYTHRDCQQQPAITASGRIVLAVTSSDNFLSGFRGAPALAIIDADGGVPEASFAGPDFSGNWTGEFPSLAPSADGRAVFVVGYGKGGHAVYRAALPDRAPLAPFFGEAENPGNDKAHLNGPRSVATDGKGLLYVADFGNNRVVALKEADGSFAGSFPVNAPFWVGAHRRSGAVYVASGVSVNEAAVLKFSGWEDARETARLQLPSSETRDRRFAWHLALDSSAEPALLWIGRGFREMRHALLRAEDRGTSFSEPAPADCVPTQWFERPTADPFKKDVLCFCGPGLYSRSLKTMNDATGEVRPASGITRGDGVAHRLGPDGTVYSCDCGGPVMWQSGGVQKRLPFGVGASGTTAWERDFFVDRRGEIYARRRGPEYQSLGTLEHYDRDGRFKRTVLWTVSAGMIGPRVDPKGNVYVMDVIHPVGQPYPEELKAGLLNSRAPAWTTWMYGSVIKFSPAGGAIWFSGKHASPLTFAGWHLSNTAYENVPPKIEDLKIAGGSLTGTIVGKNACVFVPVDTLDSESVRKVAFRLKNDSPATQAALYYNHVGENYGTYSKFKRIAIRPNSGFTEYSVDMTGEADWQARKSVRWLKLAPADDAGGGTFTLDWFRIGEGERKIEWTFDRDDSREAKLPAEMKKEQVGSDPRPAGTVLQGALWWRFGVSPLGDMSRGPMYGDPSCHCTGTDFDIDDFGRVFVPDTGRFRVGVLDTAGNEILSFGGYGNQSNCGPESYVADPTTKALRPRKAGDPADLISPFAKPEIAFGWIVGLSVTDRHAYVNDVTTKRILRVKLGYAAEGSCEMN